MWRTASTLRWRAQYQAPICYAQLRRCSQQFLEATVEPSRKFQIYQSSTNDPFLNLSIEHFLLQRTPADSTILFLYTNRPCIVIGRNQNPWLEANLSLLRSVRLASPEVEESEPIELVRRRSGGGTVFHDRGNVNYSVMCPTAAFDRDKHAEMVTRALRKLGVRQASVNERHDIVLERGEGQQSLKVSGSAYKITRLRSLHHGTCLLNSPNIADISRYLRSPAKGFLTARGVDSVSSPVTNVEVPNIDFEDAVVTEFQKIYPCAEKPRVVEASAEAIPEIGKGLQELRSPQWIYLQTPQFTVSSQTTPEHEKDRPLLPSFLPPELNVGLTARHGAITEVNLEYHENEAQSMRNILLNKQIHEIDDWTTLLHQNPEITAVGTWFNQIFGAGSH